MQTKRVLAGILTSTLLLGAYPFASAADYNDSSVTGAAGWQAWTEAWNTVATDYTQVSMTPGADETQLNFAWYSKDEAGKSATPVVHFGTDKNNLAKFTGTADAVDTSLTDGTAYSYNHVTVTGLKANTTYYYTVEKNGVQTEVKTYRTGDFESAQILYVGDPQIGASKGQSQNGEALAGDSGAANTAARNDSFAWDRTLDIALEQNPGLDFVISAGDQINKTGKPKEEEYAGYLSASALASLPVATTIGNHDSLNADYQYHFFNPNQTGYGETEAGGDYYYSYGSGLFIVLNTNNYNVAEHEKTIQEAIASDPDATFRIVTIHQDIYGSGLDHSDTDGMILRTQLTPIFDEYDIDVVLQGHDHTYSRTKLLYGDGQTHGTYEFRLNEDGSDYDWDNAYNTQTDEQIPLYPEDEAGQTKHDAFQADNECYTIEDVDGNTVTNPQGILYMTANSASGSKFYELIASQQDYVAERSQNWLPSYSVINLTADTFSIDTYQITEAGKVEKIDDTFTIKKTDEQAAAVTVDGAAKQVATADVNGETYYRLRDLATAVNGTAAQFNVEWKDGVIVITGERYDTAALAPAAETTGVKETLTMRVDGKTVTTAAASIKDNYYVPASLLNTLGIQGTVSGDTLTITTK
ncbi:purple acid phosphatase family protein [Agathobaculum sp. Marseille-P7918]|uniref:purple acid phosphatase family protein n=1 Tax=Agathobaculum sp. Marseille-P7918 TaxID=2479843 RepID=UPI000F636D53|nr:metallophosphoesterase family protein [Agathobaculum sp. Marseille-P7918]